MFMFTCLVTVYNDNTHTNTHTYTNIHTHTNRWDDDVVFKNCAKDDTSKTGRFINDTLRSEFHKKFMDKYVK